MGDIRFLQGNEAITEGAIAAGARFFAGYPITPSTEIAETSSIRLPQVGGLYVQMEDELGSIAALIGASLAGKKSYTATSGPGFSLMQENLGVAIMGEVPCVIVDVQRSGPSTGLATKPSQMDVMQSRYGTHGDHGIIVVSPSSVQDCFDLMITCFNLAEKYRTPVIFLADEEVGHLREQCELRDPGDYTVVERPQPTCSPEEYRPYYYGSDEVTPLASYGGKYVFKINGSMHDEKGAPCGTRENADRVIRHLTEKIENKKDEICMTREYAMEDAEIVIIAYGGTTRAALSAMAEMRADGHRVGVLQLVTVWPFPEKQVVRALERAKAVIVPEMNLGQLIGEVRKVNTRNIPVCGVNRVDGFAVEPEQIRSKIEEVLG